MHWKSQTLGIGFSLVGGSHVEWLWVNSTALSVSRCCGSCTGKTRPKFGSAAHIIPSAGLGEGTVTVTFFRIVAATHSETPMQWDTNAATSLRGLLVRKLQHESRAERNRWVSPLSSSGVHEGSQPVTLGGGEWPGQRNFQHKSTSLLGSQLLLIREKTTTENSLQWSPPPRQLGVTKGGDHRLKVLVVTTHIPCNNYHIAGSNQGGDKKLICDPPSITTTITTTQLHTPAISSTCYPGMNCAFATPVEEQAAAHCCPKCFWTLLRPVRIPASVNRRLCTSFSALFVWLLFFVVLRSFSLNCKASNLT